jgi:hypothetical protein
MYQLISEISKLLGTDHYRISNLTTLNPVYVLTELYVDLLCCEQVTCIREAKLNVELALAELNN